MYWEMMALKTTTRHEKSKATYGRKKKVMAFRVQWKKKAAS